MHCYYCKEVPAAGRFKVSEEVECSVRLVGSVVACCEEEDIGFLRVLCHESLGKEDGVVEETEGEAFLDAGDEVGLHGVRGG